MKGFRRIPWIIGIGVFTATFVVGWIVTKSQIEVIGVAGAIGVFHAALGIGFASGFLSYTVLNALSSKGRT